MDLKSLFAKHGVENAELLVALEGMIEREISNAGGDSIPKSRFNEVIKQRNEANAKIAELETELETSKNEKETVKKQYEEVLPKITEYDEYKKKIDNEIIDKWKVSKAKIKVEKDDPNYDKYEKVFSHFTFENETPEIAKKNLKAFELLETTGFFQDSGNGGVIDNPPKTDIPKKWKDPLAI